MELNQKIIDNYTAIGIDEKDLFKRILDLLAPTINRHIESKDFAKAKGYIRELARISGDLYELGFCDFYRNHKEIHDAKITLSTKELDAFNALREESLKIQDRINQSLKELENHLCARMEFLLAQNNLDEAMALLNMDSIKDTIAWLYMVEQIRQWKAKQA